VSGLGPGREHLVAAAVHLVPALILAIIAYTWWRQLITRRPQGLFFRIVPLITVITALHYTGHAVIELTPSQLDGRLPGLHVGIIALIDLCVVLTLALFRHLVPLLAIREEQPSRRWLAVHYGIAALFALIALLPLVGGQRALGWPTTLAVGYGGVMVALVIVDIRRLVRTGAWPRYFGTAFNVAALGATVALGAAALLGLGNVLFAPVFLGADATDPAEVPLLAHTVTGLAFAAPFAVLMLGEVVESLIVILVMLVAVGLLYFRVPALAAGMPGPELRLLVQLAGAGTLVLLLLPGRRLLHTLVHRLLFRHSERSAQALTAFLHTLSPELGVLECCRRALDEVLRVMRPRGAAIILSRGRGVAIAGTFPLEPIERVWPTGAGEDTLPRRAFGVYAIRDSTLREALVAADADLVVPVASPRQLWGHLFVSEGLLAHVTQAERHVEALEAFASQLALVLDGAELLARALGVERSLAHAEKLAAVGELAARVAHEIRNPVTAARSLAQQLCDEPGAPFPAEHALILGELERVERQVATLLRFARRDDFRFEPVGLAPLVRDTLESFRPRLEAAGVTVLVEAPEGITARADREKLRQVLVNLVENALDALADGTPTRHLGVRVVSANGHATIEVADSGPGVPAEALAHLFEPFFSLKPHGTGLGLAIAKRTIDAHGGRIAAAASANAGMCISVELPLASGA
jgi:signal transduction histidine kinase